MTEESCLKEYVDKFIHPSKQWQLKEIVDPDCDLPEIAKHITEWETKLAIPLGLTQTEISDIKKVGRSDPTQPIIERKQVLIVWKGKAKAGATYENLLTACLTGSDTNAAEKICELLQKRTIKKELNERTQLTVDDYFEEQDKQIQRQESAASTVSSCCSSEQSVVDLIPCFPFLPTDGMSEDEKKIKMNQLYRETEQIKTRFAKLIFGLQQSVQTLYTFDDFLSLLKFHDMKFEEELLKSCGTCTIAKAFREVSRFCSFYDYHIIKFWIKKFGEKKNEEALKKFGQKIQEYSKRQVYECPSSAFGNAEESEKVFSLKSERELYQMTIEEFRKLEKKTKRVLGGPVLRLLHIDEGCVELKYRTWDESIIDAITEEKQHALQSLGFVNISYGDQSLNLCSQVKNIEANGRGRDIDGDDYADSAFGTDITGAGTATHSDGGSMLAKSSGLGTDISDEFQDYVGRDLKDPRLDMIVSAETTSKQSLELHHAAVIGDLEEVKHLIAKGHNPLATNMNDKSVLQIASRYGKLDVLKYLIENVLDNLVPPTLLHEAAERGQLSIVHYLVNKHQVDPLELDKDGASPLHRACRAGYLEIVKYLMDSKLTFMKIEDIFTKYDTSLIHLAAQSDHIDILKCFIQSYHCDPNLPDRVHGRGPLLAAAQKGHLSIVKFLITECSCDPESRGDDLVTSLHLAAQNGHLSTVKYLCEDMRCNPLSRNKHNNTPLHNAAIRGQSAVIDYLINIMKCSPNLPGQYGRQPLHNASQEGHLHLVKNLIENHACDPNCLDDNKTTPLHVAAMKGHLSIIRYLIEDKECNVTLQDEKFGTPLQVAIECGQLATIKYFISLPNISVGPSR